MWSWQAPLFPELDHLLDASAPPPGQGRRARLRELFRDEPEFCALLAEQPWRLDAVLGAAYRHGRTEVPVPGERLADVVLLGSASGGPGCPVAVLEAQFGRSDDDHFGRLQGCYAPGVDATLAALVAESCRLEHIWLAQALTEVGPTAFMMVEAVLWDLGANRWRLELSRCPPQGLLSLLPPDDVLAVVGVPQPPPRRARLHAAGTTLPF
ncbi:MAG: hypothetical protein M3P85_03435 [Actinomycetota bacterium]|nr:hypothetical protein [Actinomycetota bacterium]